MVRKENLESNSQVITDLIRIYLKSKHKVELSKSDSRELLLMIVKFMKLKRGYDLK